MMPPFLQKRRNFVFLIVVGLALMTWINHNKSFDAHNREEGDNNSPHRGLEMIPSREVPFMPAPMNRGDTASEDCDELRATYFVSQMTLGVRPIVVYTFANLENQNLNSTGVCYPDRHDIPILHTKDEEKKEKYEAKMNQALRMRNGNLRDLPELYSLQNGRIGIWDCKHHYCKASAWNNETVMAEGRSPWVDPPKVYTTSRVIVGDAVAYAAWFDGIFGHYLDDHLPSIAYIKSQVPPETKFVLLDTKLARNVLSFLDPVFYERVVWVKEHEVIQVVDGQLYVTRSEEIPLFFGCCRHFDFLRYWLYQHHPTVPERRTVVYYTRKSSDTGHGRILDQDQEEQVVGIIRNAMVRYNRPEKDVVIFNGQNSWGATLSIEEQFHIFRSAKTIIGPHGAGLVGNMIWADPRPGRCNARVQVLEFIPGPDSTVVQPLFHSLFLRWRVWPIELHHILYTKESTKTRTFIDLDELRQALHVMWNDVKDKL